MQRRLSPSLSSVSHPPLPWRLSHSPLVCCTPPPFYPSTFAAPVSHAAPPLHLSPSRPQTHQPSHTSSAAPLLPSTCATPLPAHPAPAGQACVPAPQPCLGPCLPPPLPRLPCVLAGCSGLRQGVHGSSQKPRGCFQVECWSGCSGVTSRPLKQPYSLPGQPTHSLAHGLIHTHTHSLIHTHTHSLTKPAFCCGLEECGPSSVASWPVVADGVGASSPAPPPLTMPPPSPPRLPPLLLPPPLPPPHTHT